MIVVAIFLALTAIGCGNKPGYKILFESSLKLGAGDGVNPARNIWRVNTNGTDLKPLTNLVSIGADCTEPQPAPDGTQIIFVSARSLDGSDARNLNGTLNIWRMTGDGNGLMPLTRATARDAHSLQPRWSQNGSKIVFHSRLSLDGADAAHPTYNVWRVNADGTGLAPLTHFGDLGSLESFSPEWSPDGTAIIFHSSRFLDGGNTNASNIFRVNADGSSLEQLTHSSATVICWFYQCFLSPHVNIWSLRWSPLGDQIAFWSNQDLGRDFSYAITAIELMNVAGSTPPSGFIFRNTFDGAYVSGRSPQWSPDGSTLVFHSALGLDGTESPNQNHTRNIWRMNADGSYESGLTALTRNTAMGADNQDPHWSPEGRKIVFVSSRKLDGTDVAVPDAPSNIWQINSDGSGLAPLTRANTTLANSFNPRYQRSH